MLDIKRRLSVDYIYEQKVKVTHFIAVRINFQSLITLASSVVQHRLTSLVGT